jgi:hypothetical protein
LNTVKKAGGAPRRNRGKFVGDRPPQSSAARVVAPSRLGGTSKNTPPSTPACDLRPVVRGVARLPPNPYRWASRSGEADFARSPAGYADPAEPEAPLGALASRAGGVAAARAF